jgi:hypothetical protein
MRSFLASSLLAVLVAGCSTHDDNAELRKAASLDDLAVTIREQSRSYFFSDKRGGFLIGRAGSGAEAKQEWSVNGQRVLRDAVTLFIDGKTVDSGAADSIRVTPDEVIRFFHDGIFETLALLDQVPGQEQAYAIAIEVQSTSPRDIAAGLQPGSEFVAVPRHEPKSMLFKKGAIGSLALVAGGSGEVGPNGITVKQVSKAIFVIVYAAGDSADIVAQAAHGQADLLRRSRRDRMERLLQSAYLRTSDPQLTRALRWLQLSLDGLIVESPGAVAAVSLPWDGSLNVRDNAIALAGLDVATGNYAATAGMLRTIAWRDDPSVDGGAWFVREAYEHVIASGDTVLVRDIYQAVQSRLSSNANRRTDARNLLFDEKASPRGTREAHLQALWYFQQTIGSIFGSFLGDSAHAALWAQDADRTSSAFNRLFVDTSRNVVYDRIEPDGRGSKDLRPGALLCLDIIESEAVRQNTMKSIMKTLLRPYGIAMSATPEGAAGRNGATLNWMAGQMVYALTRYDCQDISYPITRRLANRVLTTDMVGVMPELYAGNDEAHALGAQASLSAMAEFVRSFYQDYLGVHVNMTTRSLALEPKLPDEMSEADFTVFAGAHPIQVRYERTVEKDRVVLRGDGVGDTLRVTFLWMMKNGNAWRGATALQPGKTTTLVFGERDATVLFDGKEAMMESMRHLVGFSQKKEMTMENGELKTGN